MDFIDKWDPLRDKKPGETWSVFGTLSEEKEWRACKKHQRRAKDIPLTNQTTIAQLWKMKKKVLPEDRFEIEQRDRWYLWQECFLVDFDQVLVGLFIDWLIDWLIVSIFDHFNPSNL